MHHENGDVPSSNTRELQKFGLICRLLGRISKKCCVSTAFKSTHTVLRAPPTVSPFLRESVPYKSFVTFNSSRQVANRQMFVVRMSDLDRARTVEVALVVAIEVGDIGTVIDSDRLETWDEGSQLGSCLCSAMWVVVCSPHLR